MQITVDSKTLSSAVSIVQMACATRSTMPIYTRVMLRTDGNRVVLAATDGELLARKTIMAKVVNEQGQCFIDPDKLLRIARLEEGDIDISLDGTNIAISTIKDEYEVAGELGEFGIDASKRGELLFTADAPVLMKAFERTMFAVDTSEAAKWTMCALRLETTNENVSVIATDGKRLAVESCMAMNLSSGSMLVPKKAADMVFRLMKGTAIVNGYASNTTASFIGDDWEVWSRQVEGRFPNWKDVVPKGFNHKCLVNVEDFLKDVRRAAVMTDEESQRLQFKIVGNKATISAQAVNTKATVVHEFNRGIEGTMSICFDPKFLVDFLGHFPSGATIDLGLNNHGSPALFTYEGGMHMIVPMV